MIDKNEPDKRFRGRGNHRIRGLVTGTMVGGARCSTDSDKLRFEKGALERLACDRSLNPGGFWTPVTLASWPHW